MVIYVSPFAPTRSRRTKVPNSLNEITPSRCSRPNLDTAMSSKYHTSSKKRCAILGATGAVGTQFNLLLAQHPLLELVAVGASEKSAGQNKSDAVRWKQLISMPAQFANLIVRRCVPTEYSDCDIIFSNLNSHVAGDIEISFLTASFAVFSKSKNFRLKPLVPLIIPVVNSEHTKVIHTHRRHYQLDKGLLVCKFKLSGHRPRHSSCSTYSEVRTY